LATRARDDAEATRAEATSGASCGRRPGRREKGGFDRRRDVDSAERDVEASKRGGRRSRRSRSSGGSGAEGSGRGPLGRRDLVSEGAAAEMAWTRM